MGEINPSNNKVFLTITASVAIVAIVAIFFGFMSFNNKSGAGLMPQISSGNEENLAGHAAMPLTEESEDIEPQIIESEPTSYFPGVEATE